MKHPLELRTLLSPGVIEEERIVIHVLVDTDIGDYILLQTGFNPKTENVTIATYHSFWFPYKRVNNGDFVVVYTMGGTNSEKKFERGEEQDKGTVHFFYWGLEDPIWNKLDRAPVLLQSPSWVTLDPAHYYQEDSNPS